MDPVSTILAIMLVIGLLKRAPHVIADLVDAAREGAWSRAYRDQLARLRKAGLAPSKAGGAARRYLANAYREAAAAMSRRRQDRR
ncbi:MAG: hypothetical protein V4597_19280, partial [Pseudomonadota bacterium]